MFWPVAERVSSESSGGTCSSFSTIFSMPVMAIWTGGAVVHIRPLPSFSTRHRVPVSATAKLTPERPMSAIEEFLAQHPAADLDQRIDVVGVIDAGDLLGEQLGDLLLGLVDGRHDDVRRLFAGQLDDVFAHVGFQRADAGRFGMAWLSSISSLTIDLPLTISLA
jgi:hypothetical protein